MIVEACGEGLRLIKDFQSYKIIVILYLKKGGVKMIAWLFVLLILVVPILLVKKYKDRIIKKQTTFNLAFAANIFIYCHPGNSD